MPQGYVSDAPLSDNRSGRGQLHGPDWNCGPVVLTWAMMALGFAGLGFAGYKRRRGFSSRLGRLSRKPEDRASSTLVLRLFSRLNRRTHPPQFRPTHKLSDWRECVVELQCCGGFGGISRAPANTAQGRYDVRERSQTSSLQALRQVSPGRGLSGRRTSPHSSIWAGRGLGCRTRPAASNVVCRAATAGRRRAANCGFSGSADHGRSPSTEKHLGSPG